jgi:hypothetical protein
MKLRQGDVYLDKDNQLVIICMDFSTAELFIVSHHRTENEFLSFSATLHTEKDIRAHLSINSRFLFNLGNVFKDIHKQVEHETL